MNRNTEAHPVWRGIGCLLMVIVPLMAYAAAVSMVKFGLSHGWPFPPEFLGNVHFPDWVWKVPVLPLIARPIENFNNIWMVLLIFLGLLIVLSAIFSTVYSYVRKATGPSRYTPVDALPSKHKPKVYKR